MFFTDPEIKKQLEYLDQERKLLWARISELDEALSKKTSDYEESAKNSSEQAITFLKAIEVIKNSLESTSIESNEKIEVIRRNAKSSDEFVAQTLKSTDEIAEKVKAIEQTLALVEDQYKVLGEKFAHIESIVSRTTEIEESVKKLEEIFEKGSSTESKINALYQSIAEKRKEIEDLYLKIIGYKEEDENGIEIEVHGLKHELESAFKDLKINIDSSTKEIASIKNEAEESYRKDISDWNEKFSGIERKISDLLPKALTAGLSYAYSEKKDAEIKDSIAHTSTFNWAIWGLVGISLIPMAISVKSMIDDIPLETVILRLPRLVLAILPLYIPVLWVAYSANRRKNLSKRLIEEYSHKEVLSKTFEGLSKQIENIGDGEISEDLRVKLLYNILEVNSENPGKLISDYNKSDHPLMDALDKSIKLSNAVSKLAKIPGFARLAANLERKSQEILKSEEMKANAAIDSLDVKTAPPKQ